MTKTTLSVLFMITILLSAAFAVHTKNKEPFTVSYAVVASQ